MAQQTIKFGNAGLRGETPVGIKWAYRILMYASILWTMTIQPNMEFSDHVQALINQWILVANGTFYTFCQFFGWANVDAQIPKSE